jgi:hypothetical protein
MAADAHDLRPLAPEVLEINGIPVKTVEARELTLGQTCYVDGEEYTVFKVTMGWGVSTTWLLYGKRNTLTVYPEDQVQVIMPNGEAALRLLEEWYNKTCGGVVLNHYDCMKRLRAYYETA